jgi:folate-binding Fe-S cluster repair protein YgfZ
VRLVERCVSFDKGCYIGQEIINRLDVMGQVTKKIWGLEMVEDALPPRGAEVRIGEDVVGATLSGGTELKDKKTGKIRGYRLGKQADAEKPAGEWNTFTTVCDGNTVTILVNGKEVNSLKGANLSSGFIGLQSEGGAFEVKEAVIEPL